MNFKHAFGPTAAATAAVLILAAAGGAGPASAQAARAASVKPLVRLDLLQPVASTLAPERRNIFIAGPAASEPPLPPAQRGKPRVTAEDAEEASPGEQSVEIHYVGYISSPRGLIGLVLVQGTAQAVAQGDAIQPGYTVSRLTRREIEITGPDGAKTTHVLQGVKE
jgi:hypothetical protein